MKHEYVYHAPIYGGTHYDYSAMSHGYGHGNEYGHGGYGGHDNYGHGDSGSMGGY